MGHLGQLDVRACALGEREAAEGNAKVGSHALQVGVVADHNRQLTVQLTCGACTRA